MRISLTITDGKEEIHLITCLVYQVWNAITAFTDTEIIINEPTIRKDTGQQHVVDIADMSQMTVPVEGVGMTTTDSGINGIARQTVFPENRSFSFLEMRLIPDIHTQLAPLRTPWSEVSLVDGKFFRILVGYELRLTRHGPYMLGILGFAKTHIIIASYGIAIGLIIHIGRDIEVHATTYILDHQTVAA